MVATSSAAQAAENEKRMRKTTIEKVKANHLSRQLQMRLQYARLKVEHGWQKQNLNEVENLYFHNSHLRGPKTLPTTAPVTVQQQVPTPSQSSLSFKLGGTNLSRVDAQSVDHAATINDSPDVQASNAISQMEPMVVDKPAAVNQPVSMETTEKALSVLMTALSNSSVSGVTTGAMSDRPEAQESQPPESTGPPNHYPLVKPPRPRLNKGASSSRAVQSSSLTARDMVNFRLGGSLTYDSFWSSHSVPVLPSRQPQDFFANNNGSMGLNAASQISMDSANSMENHSRSNSDHPPSPKPPSASTPEEILPITVPP